MFTVLNVLLVAALLMLALLIAASASIPKHATADIELDTVGMYRQSDSMSTTPRAIRASRTNYSGRGVRQRTNKTSFCRNHLMATKRK